MKLISTNLLFVYILQNMAAQPISDRQFKWAIFDECKPLFEAHEVYLKVEKDLVLLDFSEMEFNDFLKKTIHELSLSNDVDSVIKMKVLFALNTSLCVLELGEKDMALTAAQKEFLKQKIMSIKSIRNGQQRGVEQNCQGILYIEVQKGKFSKMRNVNFGIGN